MPKLVFHGRSPITIGIRLCPMVILGFLPFHHPSIVYVSVMEVYYSPELEHLRVMCLSNALLVYAEAWSPGPMF
jgi:hypothetical protein